MYFCTKMFNSLVNTTWILRSLYPLTLITDPYLLNYGNEKKMFKDTETLTDKIVIC